jgi:hypothetical protein
MTPSSKYSIISPFYHCNSSRPKRVEISELPRITERVQYQQAIRLPSHKGAGLLTFKQQDVLRVLERYIFERSGNLKHQPHPFDEALLAWACNVDLSSETPCALPVAWEGIEYPLLRLLRENAYEAFCAECRKSFQPSEIPPCDTSSEGNVTYEGIFCPSKHRLFVVEICNATV